MAASPADIQKLEAELKDIQAKLNASMDKTGADANAETLALGQKLNELRTKLAAARA